MTVTIETDVWQDEETRVVTWSSSLGSPEYYVYQDGKLVTKTFAETWTFHIPSPKDTDAPREDPLISILDDSTPPGYTSPGRIYLSWYPDPDAAYYLIEEEIESVFTEVVRIPETGRGYYRWLTQWLTDGYETAWRITPVDAAGNSGTPFDFEFTQVRHPDTPNVEFSYSDITGTVTITEGT